MNASRAKSLCRIVVMLCSVIKMAAVCFAAYLLCCLIVYRFFFFLVGGGVLFFFPFLACYQILGWFRQIRRQECVSVVQDSRSIY